MPSSLRLPRVLFPEPAHTVRRPTTGWRLTAGWRILLVAVAVAWLVGFLWPDLSALGL